MKETLSISQARQILQVLGDLLDRCADKMNDELNNFLKNLSQIWADNIARDLGKDIFHQSQEIMNVLGKNYNTMANTLEDIVRYYKNVGGMTESFYAVHRVYQSYVDSRTMTEYFSDGNGDDFGFKDIYNGPNQVIEILKDYIIVLRKSADELKSNIEKIQAFGNTAITRELANSGKTIVTIVEASIEALTNMANEHIELASKAYGKIGQEAKTQLQEVRTAINE